MAGRGGLGLGINLGGLGLKIGGGAGLEDCGRVGGVPSQAAAVGLGGEGRAGGDTSSFFTSLTGLAVGGCRGLGVGSSDLARGAAFGC